MEIKNKISKIRKEMLKCIENIENSKEGSSIERIYIKQYNELKNILETLENCHVAEIKENSLGQEIVYFFTDNSQEIKAMFENVVYNTGLFDTCDFWNGSDYEPLFIDNVFKLRYEYDNLTECKHNLYTCSNLKQK